MEERCNFTVSCVLCGACSPEERGGKIDKGGRSRAAGQACCLVSTGSLIIGRAVKGMGGWIKSGARAVQCIDLICFLAILLPIKNGCLGVALLCAASPVEMLHSGAYKFICYNAVVCCVVSVSGRGKGRETKKLQF